MEAKATDPATTSVILNAGYWGYFLTASVTRRIPNIRDDDRYRTPQPMHASSAVVAMIAAFAPRGITDTILEPYISPS
jgi:hypothetical protein